MTDIDIDVGKSKGDEDGDNSSGSGGGGGGGGRRSHIFVKMRYGTRQFPPDTDCDECGARAVGVMIPDEDTVQDDGLVDPRPLCSTHRDDIKQDKETFFQEGEFRRFIDA